MTYNIEDFIASCPTSNPSTLHTYRVRLATCERLHGRPLGQASAHSLGDLKEKLRKMRSGRSYAKDLRAFYTRMGKPALADLCRLKQRIEKLDRSDLLSLDEVNRILEAADMMRDRAVVAMLWGTGQRIDAVLSLRLKDLSEMEGADAGGIRVFFWRVKVNGKQHVGYLLNEDGAGHVRAWLKAYPFKRFPDAPIFPAREGEALKPDTFREILKVLAKQAGIEKRVHPHLFRHSRATYLKLMGVSDSSIKQLLGWHRGSNVLEQTYSHMVDTDARDDLLRAHGHDVARTVNLGKLAAAEGELRPVVPMILPEDVQAKEPELPPELLREVKELASRPEVRRFMDLLEAMREAPARSA